MRRMRREHQRILEENLHMLERLRARLALLLVHLALHVAPLRHLAGAAGCTARRLGSVRGTTSAVTGSDKL